MVKISVSASESAVSQVSFVIWVVSPFLFCICTDSACRSFFNASAFTWKYSEIYTVRKYLVLSSLISFWFSCSLCCVCPVSVSDPSAFSSAFRYSSLSISSISITALSDSHSVFSESTSSVVFSSASLTSPSHVLFSICNCPFSETVFSCWLLYSSFRPLTSSVSSAWNFSSSIHCALCFKPTAGTYNSAASNSAADTAPAPKVPTAAVIMTAFFNWFHILFFILSFSWIFILCHLRYFHCQNDIGTVSFEIISSYPQTYASLLSVLHNK